MVTLPRMVLPHLYFIDNVTSVKRVLLGGKSSPFVPWRPWQLDLYLCRSSRNATSMFLFRSFLKTSTATTGSERLLNLETGYSNRPISHPNPPSAILASTSIIHTGQWTKMSPVHLRARHRVYPSRFSCGGKFEAPAWEMGPIESSLPFRFSLLA